MFVCILNCKTILIQMYVVVASVFFPLSPSSLDVDEDDDISVVRSGTIIPTSEQKKERQAGKEKKSQQFVIWNSYGVGLSGFDFGIVEGGDGGAGGGRDEEHI